jgi:hypothetical protein
LNLTYDKGYLTGQQFYYFLCNALGGIGYG